MKTVHTTKHYGLFKPIDGNRNKNLIHINRLKKSMSEKYLFTIIIVNENYEIIDGQHRFEVIKELNLPLHYVICEGYGLGEVHKLNQNAKKWTSSDYLDAYCNLGYIVYLNFKNFMRKHDISIQIAMFLLSGDDSGSMVKTFNSGEFVISKISDAEIIMSKLNRCSVYFSNYKTRWFVFAIAKLSKKPQFVFDEFINKLKLQPTSLKKCTDVSGYIDLIEEIYNYRRHEKVNLRY
jgi:hypothetical protein